MSKFIFNVLVSSCLATSVLLVNPIKAQASIESIGTVRSIESGQNYIANASFDVRGCASLQLPQTINLLRPIDPQLERCIPDLGNVNQSFVGNIAGRINGALSRLEMGNEGRAELHNVVYSVPGQEIIIEGIVRPRQVTTTQVPVRTTRREQVPVRTTRRVEVPVPTTRTVRECLHPTLGNRCLQWVETEIPDGRFRMEWREVTSMRMEWREVPSMRMETRSVVTYSARCNFKYTYNLATRESTPLLNCEGGLGSLRFDASAIARLLNGEVPTIGSIISAWRVTPPGLVERLDDTYDRIRSSWNVQNLENPTVTYFASRSFVEWASARNQAINIAATIASGGSLSGEMTRELIERLRSEFTFFSSWAAQQGMNIAFEQFLELIQTGRINSDIGVSTDRIMFRFVNVPVEQVTCLTGTNRCTPSISEPRLGFVIQINGVF